MIDVLLAIGFWFVVGAPLILSAAAFLDAARRPEWAWVMSGRRRVIWMGVIVGGGVTYFLGPVVWAIYWFTARRDVAAIERGDFDGFT